VSIDPKGQYKLTGAAVIKTANAVREYESRNSKPPLPRHVNAFVPREFEGVLAADLDAADDVDTPASATFQIQKGAEGQNLANWVEPVKCYNRTQVGYASGTYGTIRELYPQIFYFFPLSSSTGNTIRFQIYEADCEGRSIVARVKSSRGAVPEAYTIDGETELNELGETVASQFVPAYDKVGCYLNESNINLVGRYGYATYLYGSPKYNYQPWLGWEVTALCEQQTECEAL